MSDHGIPEKVEALESILVEKGYVHPETLDAIVTTYDGDVGPRNGAHVVARSWVDPAYRERLRADATAAIAELGSCYPWPVLGLPPTWYKSPAYRSRAVLDPRGVLADFGVTLPEATRITVHDSTAEIRYLVVPMRPEGTEDLDEEALAALVTRDGMIGTALL
jgi:nitrile hydratase